MFGEVEEQKLTLPCNIPYLLAKISEQIPADKSQLKINRIMRDVKTLFEYFDSVIHSSGPHETQTHNYKEYINIRQLIASTGVQCNEYCPRSPKLGVDDKYPLYNQNRELD